MPRPKRSTFSTNGPRGVPESGLPVGSFTIVVLPDTQVYSWLWPDIFRSQTEWIVANQANLNVQMVLHVGDLVNVPDDSVQWASASAAMDVLTQNPQKVTVPYMVLPGNHDLFSEYTPNTIPGNSWGVNPDFTNYNRYFGLSRFRRYPWYKEGFPPGTNNNSYAEINLPHLKLGVICLWDQPARWALEWAARIVSRPQNADRYFILNTHDYVSWQAIKHPEKCGSPMVQIYDPGPPAKYKKNLWCYPVEPDAPPTTWLEPNRTAPIHTPIGEGMWEGLPDTPETALVKGHRNIFMVMCGHWINVDPARLVNVYHYNTNPDTPDGNTIVNYCAAEDAHYTRQRDDGSTVHELVTNYQNEAPNCPASGVWPDPPPIASDGQYGYDRSDCVGKTGKLRYYIFMPGGVGDYTIYAYTYSPTMDKYYEDPDSQFILNSSLR
jgi:hypothetical protein